MALNNNYRLSDFNFDLPEELIAQYPSSIRDASRLLVLNKNTGEIEHRMFNHISGLLRKGDLLVLNNARVIHARVKFKRETGGIIETILTRRTGNRRWLIVTNKTRRLKPGEVLTSLKDENVKARIAGRQGDYLNIETNLELDEKLIEQIGSIPLPPYIKRENIDSDEDRYQTVYASESGAIASPTAGLHFTKSLMDELKNVGVILVYLTLYVSWGTFRPVREEIIEKHKMDIERFYLPDDTAEQINLARREGRRIVAVGTTTLRVLESTYNNGVNISGPGETDIFIYPPYKIRSINALITNFHTPESTLLMLVSAYAGYKNIMSAYKQAMDMKYRFFSYGDSMFIL